MGRLLLGDGFIRNHGYVYATVQWNKLVLERQRAAGTLDPSSPTIERGTDGYLILRDLSDFLRRPADLLSGAQPPCGNDDVIAFGHSQTGMLLRQFYFSGLNSALAHGSSFDDRLVFEGSMHSGPGAHCRRLTDTGPWFSYTFDGCAGRTPPAQGDVVTVNSETDVQLINGWRARTSDLNDRHYRV